ncbi:transcriptional regulator with XRE-family HTH domain [Paenarthrobacter nicotinovorans]|uniref:Transcriptional regulator with XRE-family HTH domain n=2 Tax=Paenarthrobacter nicotinovorans TaxID=29320 RepID=A0ABT9TPW3_PAENI|nr:transcriptional regulator with XRE-family HTH domain [Paenarthrobacter nicotinovorans]
MSQRAFAKKLTDRGMAIDASAVSRIESGSRALRLTEALIISDVLNVDIDLLISGARTETQEFRTRRRYADLTMGQLEDAALDFLAAFGNVNDYLQAHPELLVELDDDNLGRPASTDQYLDWVGSRMEQIQARPGTEVVAAKDRAEADALKGLITRFVTGFVSVREDEVSDGEHPEA